MAITESNTVAGPGGILIPDLKTYALPATRSGTTAASAALASSSATSAGAQSTAAGSDTVAPAGAATVQNQSAGAIDATTIQILGVLVGIIAIYAATKG